MIVQLEKLSEAVEGTDQRSRRGASRVSVEVERPAGN